MDPDRYNAISELLSDPNAVLTWYSKDLVLLARELFAEVEQLNRQLFDQKAPGITERRKYALLQAAAVLLNPARNSFASGALDDAEALLTEIERRGYR